MTSFEVSQRESAQDPLLNTQRSRYKMDVSTLSKGKVWLEEHLQRLLHQKQSLDASQDTRTYKRTHELNHRHGSTHNSWWKRELRKWQSGLRSVGWSKVWVIRWEGAGAIIYIYVSHLVLKIIGLAKPSSHFLNKKPIFSRSRMWFNWSRLSCVCFPLTVCKINLFMHDLKGMKRRKA